MSQGFEKCQDYNAAQITGREHLAFSIHYGFGGFKMLNYLCLIAPDKTTFAAWTDGLEQYTRDYSTEYSTDKVTQRWLERNWNIMTGGKGDIGITVKDFKNWLMKVNLKLSTRDTKDIFNSVDRYKAGSIGKASLVELYHDLVDDTEITRMFDRFSSDPSHTLMSAIDVTNFFKKEYGEELSLGNAQDIVTRYTVEGKFKVSNFVEFLHGTENEIWQPQYLKEVYENMNLPLTHYYHASSHNTYLTGDQLKSKSSCEAYIRALRDGCRCVEIDTWNGSDGDPVVYHGHTLTSKIKFRDVMPCIVEHGFVSSPYPIILSIENHCDLKQQRVMAEIFKKELRDSMIISQLNSDQAYPSPEALKYRVIIKHKKLKTRSEDEAVAMKNSNDGDEDKDISESIKNGRLSLAEIDGTWTKHIFVLNNSKLTWMEDTENDGQADDPEDVVEGGQVKEEKSGHDELHYGEAWFHGPLNGRGVAEQRLSEYMNNNKGSATGHNGLFLVRESNTFQDEFSLSFFRAAEGKFEHCRIRCRSGKFFLTDQVAFVNLYELIEYYRREPLKSAAFKIQLTEAVPQPAAHLNEKWFHKQISRGQAEDMLRKVAQDGAYLVRESTSDKNGLSISFRAEGKIKHCRVRKEGRMYCIGDTEFDSMVEMVDYYTQHALYRKMKLRFAVDEAMAQAQAQANANAHDPDQDIYSSQSLYQTPNSIANARQTAPKVAIVNPNYHAGAGAGAGANGVTVRAKFAYRAAQKDELSFPIDAIITEVEKKDGGWWMGRYADMKGWLPSNYVQDVVVEDQIGDVLEDDGDENPLGKMQKNQIHVTELMRVEPRPSQSDMRLIFRIVGGPQPHGEKNWVEVGAEGETAMKDWAGAVAFAIEQQRDQATANQQTEQKFRIAIDLSDLIFYCTSVRWKEWGKSAAEGYQQMSSWNEKKAGAACSEKNGDAAQFVRYNTRNFSRAYPRGTRVDSSNYDPQPMWNCGMQLVALNYQFADRPMWINRGKFRLNGKCGYVTKPHLLRDHKFGFDPYKHQTWQAHVKPVNVTVTVLSARHLIKPGRGVASPYVEVDVVGVMNDTAMKRRTRVIQDNGFKPTWNETFKFEISMPELACLVFTVNDEDMFGDSNAIGQAVLPLGTFDRPTLRPGWRSIQLHGVYGDPMPLSALLVKCTVNHTEADKEYQSLQNLRAAYRRDKEQRDDIVQAKARAVHNGQSFSQFDSQLDELNPKVLAMGDAVSFGAPPRN